LELRKKYDFELALIRGHGKDSNQTHSKWNKIVDNACSWAMVRHNEAVTTYQLLYDITQPRPTIIRYDDRGMK